MNQDVELYCMMAINRDLLTADQYAILCEINTPDNTLPEFVELIDLCGLMNDPEIRQELTAQIDFIAEHGEEAALAAAEGRTEVEATTRDASDGVPLSLDWFCYMVADEGLLAGDICACLYANLEDAGDLLGFAQSLVATGMVSDMEKIQELVEKSREMEAGGNPPPSSVLTPA